MPHNLDLQRPGGTLTGSTLNLGLAEDPQLAVDLGPELSPEVVASLESSLPGLEGTAQPPRDDFLTKPFSEFTAGDRLRFAIKGGLAGPEAIMQQRQGAIKAQAAQQKAKFELNAKTLDVIIKSIEALEAITDPRRRIKVAKLLGSGIAKFNRAAGNAFEELADEPAITELVSNPALADELEALGGLNAVLSQFDGTPAEKTSLLSRVADIHRPFIFSKITEIQNQFPEKFKNVDLNDDGTISTGEVLAFTSELIEDEEIPEELRLSNAEWNVFNFSEFEADVASLFGAQTRAGAAAAQVRAAPSLQRLSARTPDGKVVPAVFSTKSGEHEISLDGGTTFQAAPADTQFFTRSATGTLEEIAPGTSVLTKAQLGKVQEQLSSLDKQMNQLEEISNEFNAELLTIPGRVKAKVGRGLDFLGVGGEIANSIIKLAGGPDLIKFGASQSDFISKVEAFFQAYRKNITGAQAAFAEFAQLKKAVISGDLPPETFSVRLKSLMERIKVDIESKKGLLRQGIDIRPTRDEEAAFQAFDLEAAGGVPAPAGGTDLTTLSVEDLLDF